MLSRPLISHLSSFSFHYPLLSSLISHLSSLISHLSSLLSTLISLLSTIYSLLSTLYSHLSSFISPLSLSSTFISQLFHTYTHICTYTHIHTRTYTHSLTHSPVGHAMALHRDDDYLNEPALATVEVSGDGCGCGVVFFCCWHHYSYCSWFIFTLLPPPPPPLWLREAMAEQASVLTQY